LRVNGELRLNRVATLNNEAVVKNDSRFAHSSDANLNFGSVGGNEFMLASRETVNETGGIRGDGDNISIWSPGDFGRLVRFLDEDFWIDNNSNPYDNGAERAYIDQNGQYFQVSDKNKKSNIKLITSALDKISNISGYTYTYKINKETEAKGEKPKKAIGLLAQELQKSIPEAVEENDSNELFVNYSALIGVLVQANKELLEKVNTLQTRIENLEKK
ncbi:MAG: tail fiber domain-containing protein, partial [Flavobacteriales bacterium]|nr:tail fiber domain-containing protein [Flavobacteriales bacterium]